MFKMIVENLSCIRLLIYRLAPSLVLTFHPYHGCLLVVLISTINLILTYFYSSPISLESGSDHQLFTLMMVNISNIDGPSCGLGYQGPQRHRSRHVGRAGRHAGRRPGPRDPPRDAEEGPLPPRGCSGDLGEVTWIWDSAGTAGRVTGDW